MFKNLSKRCDRTNVSYYVGLRPKRTDEDRIVNIRLRPDQEERSNANVEQSAILDTSKFVRITVDWLLRSDIGEVSEHKFHW